MSGRFLGVRSGLSAPLRIVTALVLGVFVVVSVATTVYSLGAYCLTSGNGPIALLGF